MTDEGLLGYVQPVGAAPGDSFPDYTEVYGVGAFLAAGSEIYKMLSARGEQAQDSRNRIRTFMYNGGWCWFQDPRAVMHGEKLIIGGVAGNGRGDAAVGVYDLGKDILLGRTTVAKDFDSDDHNSPVVYPRPDGSLLTVYARHSTENKHYYRISGREDYLVWGDEQIILHDDPVTYSNLLKLSDENTLYNSYRGIDWNPSFVTSGDDGESWGRTRHFIQDELSGIQRPYARYTSNGMNTVAVSFTDAHPRDFGNSIYYAEFRNGSFYRADGTAIKNLDRDGPLKPSEAEEVFQGGGGRFRGPDSSARRSAWTSSVELDEKGHPHIGYTLYLSNADQRYLLASWDGSQWIDREIAFAGTRLYEREASYTGLVTLDPADPSHVVISTDVNPSTGQAALGGKHQIFYAHVSPADTTETIHWEQLTDDSERDNIRPIVVTGRDRRAILWLRGQYNTYTDYYLDVVGISF